MPISSVLSVVAGVGAAVNEAAVTEVAADAGEEVQGEVVRTDLLPPSLSMTRLHSHLCRELKKNSHEFIKCVGTLASLPMVLYIYAATC